MASDLRTVLRFVALWLLLVPGAAAQFQAIVVDDDGPADFADLQSAIDAASSGDVILVESGVYDPAILDGKGLTIVRASAQMPAIFDTAGTPGMLLTAPILHVTNVPAGEACYIGGFTVFNGVAGPGNLVVESCDGPVWLLEMFLDSYGAEALVVRNARSAVIVQGLAQTNLFPPLPDGTPVPGPGALIEQSSEVWGYDTGFSGSHGALLLAGLPALLAPPSGGPGAVVDESSLRVWDSDVKAGSGNSLSINGCTQGGNGGAGLVLVGASASAFFADKGPQGGFPGFFDELCAPLPSMGPDISGDLNAVTMASGVTRVLSAPLEADVGESIVLGLQGVSGETAWLFLAGRAASGQRVAGVDLHLEISSLLLLAALPMVADQLSVPVIVPPLPLGIEAVTVPLQAVFIDGNGGRLASNPWAVTLH